MSSKKSCYISDNFTSHLHLSFVTRNFHSQKLLFPSFSNDVIHLPCTYFSSDYLHLQSLPDFIQGPWRVSGDRFFLPHSDFYFGQNESRRIVVGFTHKFHFYVREEVKRWGKEEESSIKHIANTLWLFFFPQQCWMSKWKGEKERESELRDLLDDEQKSTHKNAKNMIDDHPLCSTIYETQSRA